MKSDLRNEIKAYIVRQGMTMQEVVDVLSDLYPGGNAISSLYQAGGQHELRGLRDASDAGV